MTEQPCDIMPAFSEHTQLAQLNDRALQRVDVGYATAISVQKPRQLPMLERNALQEATLLGESAFYCWSAGGQRVEGPTIKLANVLLRLWGNCAVRLEPIQDLPDSWVFTASFIDLETGYTLQRQFRQTKRGNIGGKYDVERKMDMLFQIGQSKVIRNVAINALPDWLVTKAMDAAQGGVRAKLVGYIEKHGEDKARKMVVDRLGKVGVNEPAILAKTGRSTVAGLTIEDLIRLAGDCRALEDGAETVTSLFPESGEKPTTIKTTASRLKERVQEARPAMEPVARDANGTPIVETKNGG